MTSADFFEDLTCRIRSTVPSDQFAATVVIVTRNRREDALRAAESALSQTVPTEVLVITDGTEDDTCERLVHNFGDALTVYHSDRSRGYIARRNQAARLARSALIVSIDDDSMFSDPATLATVLPIFCDPRVAAVAMPYINILRERCVRQLAEGGSLMVVDRYIGTAHMIRRDAFLAAGGYREQYFHQGEERDLCLRLLNEAQFTVLGTTSPIYHFESPRRNAGRMMYYGRQNDVLFAMWNVPMPYVLFHLPYTTVRGLIFALRRRPLREALAGLFRGYAVGVRYWKLRTPVTSRTYRLARRLRKCGPLPLERLVSGG